MKRTLIMGVCLLISGAAIYGFVDYIKTDKKQLEELYKEQPPVAKTAIADDKPVAAVAKKEVAVDVNTAKENPVAKTNTDKKNEKRSRRISLKQYSRAKLDEKFIPPVVKKE